MPAPLGVTVKAIVAPVIAAIAAATGLAMGGIWLLVAGLVIIGCGAVL